MADSTLFDFTAAELEQATHLDRLEARGTLRLALKEAIFEARTVTRPQMEMVVGRVLAGELSARGVQRAQVVCEHLLTRLKECKLDSSPHDSADEIFARLIRR